MEDTDTTRIVGIWETGGYGKSTAARECYEKMRSLHEHDTKFHFVEKINQNNDGSVNGLVKQLYSSLLSEENLASGGMINVRFERDRLLRSKVFVVLDDVHTYSQLEELLLDKALKLTELFAKGSRIIITTRNKDVLSYANAEASTYQVMHLTDVESLELFMYHAFEPGFIIACKGRDERALMSLEVVTYCHGNPLAIKVLGCALLRKDKRYWDSYLMNLGKNEDHGIDFVLRRSYELLKEHDKRLFLDIACFFYGTMRSLLEKYMDSIHPNSHSRVEGLINNGLLISKGDDKIKCERIVVDELFREMAWNIVNEEYDIGKRSRLKDHDDIDNLLSREQGEIRATQGIRLDLSKVEVMHLKANAFQGMNDLRWLDFGWPRFVGSENDKIQLLDGKLDSLPNELRGLNWDQFPCHTLPLRFIPKRLVYLVIRHSPIQICWEKTQKLEYLILLCLSNCENLTTIPSLSHCANLEHILLSGCKTLTELPKDIQFLENLVTLDARNCLNLELVPSKLNSKLLKQLLLSNCPKLTSCPKVNSPHLQALDCDGTPIILNPNSIYKVKQDGIVSLYGRNITHFPQFRTKFDLLRLRDTSIQEIKIKNESPQVKFDRLHLIKNTQLTTLPTDIWGMVSSELIIEDCPLIRCLPVISEPSYSLTTLRVGGCEKVVEFPSCICKLRCLEVLGFVGTDITTLPSCIGELKQLTYLDVSNSTSLESVPDTISELGKLSELVLIGCGSNVSLPEKLPPNLNVVKESNSFCSTLRALMNNIGDQKFSLQMTDDGSKLVGDSVAMTATQDTSSPSVIKVRFM
ncbi:Disease resistance protein RUN1 [Linum perenne]